MNLSTAKDVCLLSIVCMKIARFREVVGTKIFKTRAINVANNNYYWENTNKMLWRKNEHWVGCKTGVTEPAGPCFSGFYENN